MRLQYNLKYSVTCPKQDRNVVHRTHTVQAAKRKAEEAAAKAAWLEAQRAEKAWMDAPYLKLGVSMKGLRVRWGWQAPLAFQPNSKRRHVSS